LSIKYKIDIEKLVSCMERVFGYSDWDVYKRYDRTNIKYLTPNGIPILGPSYNMVDLVDKDIQSELLLSRTSPRGNHMGPILWSIGVYLTEYKQLKLIPDNIDWELESSWFDDDIPKDIDDYHKGMYGLNLLQGFLEKSKLCRVVITEEVKSLNIESHHPLTSSQRRFLLDVIKGLNINLDKVFIDDYSSEQSVRRQVGLSFF